MSKAMELREVVRFIDQLLNVASESDREGNGLAVTAGEMVTKLGAALNTSFESIHRAGELGVDLLLVHHTSWEMIDLHLKEEKFAQLRNLGVSLYAAHEVLDRAPDFGTADALASLLGLTIEGRWGQGLGVYGTFSVKSFAALVNLAQDVLDGPVEGWQNNSEFRRGAIATGAAGMTTLLQEARELGCDTYVTGERKSVICALIDPESETPNAMQLNHWMFSHELLHLWLGGAIQPQEPELVWFQEGMPCYYATLSSSQFLSDTEAESKSRFLESLREWYAKAKQITGLSIKEAVSIFAKGDFEKSHGVISNKGPLVCWILDLEIRIATKNRKCLADLMKILYQRFGNQPKAYSNDDVFAIASELSGQDYEWIYEKYISGTEPIPFEDYLAKASV